MQCHVIKSFNRRGVIQNPGTILDIPEDMLPKMAGYVNIVTPSDSYAHITKNSDTLSPFCGSYNGHCSVKIGGNYPAECGIRNCEYLDLPPVPGKVGVYPLAAYCPAHTNETTQHTICPNCGCSDFWQSAVQDHHSVCRRCHPPAPGAEKVPAP